ncbi:MAG TPA: hypothetical protein VGC98_08495 [Thermoleophilaceae bacterium]|jgi:hypothetical protein
MRLIALLALALLAVAIGSHASGHERFQRGFVLLGWKNDTYLQPRSDAALRRIAAGGADHVAIFSQWFLADPTASVLAPDPERSPSDASVLHAMRTARALGLEVTLKPQIGIRSGSWIGTAHPADIAAFWNNYSAMLLHYGDLAQRGGASTLVIGTEMATLSSDEQRWRHLIGQLRARFHGALTYAANYDEYQRVPFWDALDYIGIDAYFPLADGANPSPTKQQLAAAWSARGYLSAIGALARKTGKRVLFTELGYRAVHGTALHPSAWDAPGATDIRAQADAYEAFYAAVAQQPWMAGVYWWAVNPDGSPTQDYDPTGKPAERVVARENVHAKLPW